MLNAFYISTVRDDFALPMFCIFMFFKDFFIPLKFLLSNRNCFTSAIKCCNLLWENTVAVPMCTDLCGFAEAAFFLLNNSLQLHYHHETS